MFGCSGVGGGRPLRGADAKDSPSCLTRRTAIMVGSAALGLARAGRVHAGRAAQRGQPGERRRRDPAGGARRRLWPAAPPQARRVGAGQALAATPLPVIVFFYGGGWVSGDRGDYGFAGRAFAAQRLRHHRRRLSAGPASALPAFLAGRRAGGEVGARSCRRLWRRPRRISLAGHSAGAYEAAMLALDPHYLRDAGVDPRSSAPPPCLRARPISIPSPNSAAATRSAQWPQPARDPADQLRPRRRPADAADARHRRHRGPPLQ